MTMQRPKMCRSAMLKNVQQLAFAVHETVLFLDVHPGCPAALEYYHRMNARLKEALAEYEMTWGPLTQNGVVSENEWTWSEGPWPWQYEANVCAER